MHIILIVALILTGCGKLHTPELTDNKTTYTINKYNNGIYIGGWVSTTKVYLKFEDKFIEVLGDYTIEENINE